MGLDGFRRRAARQLVMLLTERDFGALVASDTALRGLFGDPSVARWRSRRCTNCDADFAPATNGPTACSYHPAGLFEWEDSAQVDIFYVCCEGPQFPGAVVYPPLAPTDSEDQDLRDLRAVPGCVTSAHEVCRPITGDIPDGPIQAYSAQLRRWVDATAREGQYQTFLVTLQDGGLPFRQAKHTPYRLGAGPMPYPLLLRHPPVSDWSSRPTGAVADVTDDRSRQERRFST